MDVWVVEKGVYAEAYPAAVYSTAKKAMEAFPVPSEEDIKKRRIPNFRADGWKQKDDGDWDNGLDMDWSATVMKYELDPKED